MAKKTTARKTARKTGAKTTRGKKAVARKPAKASRRVVSHTQEGRVTLPGAAKNLALEELRDRILIEIAALVETERVPGRSYKLVLVVKRTRNTPLSYKLVVERSG